MKSSPSFMERSELRPNLACTKAYRLRENQVRELQFSWSKTLLLLLKEVNGDKKSEFWWSFTIKHVIKIQPCKCLRACFIIYV